jgi:hypothetical protein
LTLDQQLLRDHRPNATKVRGWIESAISLTEYYVNIRAFDEVGRWASAQSCCDWFVPSRVILPPACAARLVPPIALCPGVPVLADRKRAARQARTRRPHLVRDGTSPSGDYCCHPAQGMLPRFFLLLPLAS